MGGKRKSICFIMIMCNCFRVVPSLTPQEVNERSTAGVKIAVDMAITYFQLFQTCVATSMDNPKIAQRNLQKYLVQPSRTTVGFGNKFTVNRKFFANLLSTVAFREMLEKDHDHVRTSYIQKMRYCDNAVMDQSLMRDFYDREVDQSKI